jgi:transcription termination factor Rho
MSVLTRSGLESSPLADLHELASELGLDGFRRLRKADLVDAILERQGGDGGDDGDGDGAAAVAAPEAEEAAPKRRRGTRGGRGRRNRDEDREEERDEEPAAERAEEPAEEPEAEVEPAPEFDEADEEPEAREAPRSRGGRKREERVVSGTVELLPNGSGFVRITPPEPSDDDVYVSAAQIRRCELVSGDVVSGPVREPRRSERYPSLIRVDTINDKPADEVAEGTHFDDLPCELPSERFALDSEDATLKAIEWLTPLGRGSRATIVGPEHSGKSEALRRLAGALNAVEGVDVHVVLAGVRPEEVAAWRAGEVEPVAALSLTASAEAQSQAVERAIDTAKRIAARGGHVVVLIDGVEGVGPQAARRCLAAARNIVDGGSLTVIATAPAPVGGETTIIALDRTLTRTGRFPALDLANSGTMQPERLVGEAGADAIAQARATALSG